ncbi:MAG: outer membrane protein assembly factor BamA [Akkermansia sp.]|nr:outer membrane protein assembly factor BamA [Akkermansia sp.]
MNMPSLHWRMALTALACSLASPAVAQESTGDPFLDAMMKDQQEQSASTPKPAAQQPAPAEEDPFARMAAERKARQQKEAEQAAAPIQTRLVSTTDETRLLDDAEVSRELGPATGLFNNDAAFDGRKVTEVQFRYTGERTVPDERLRDVVQTREGSTYSASRLNADLERLIERGIVDADTSVSVLPQGSKGVRVIFDVRASSVLAGVGFKGVTEFEENDLREASKLQHGNVLNDRALATARAEIIKYYQEAGYPDTKVSWQAKETENKAYKDVVFDVQEGDKVSMNIIRFEGNHAFDDEQLRQLMKTKERGFFTWITKSGRIDREQVEDDLDAIVRHYRNYGYLRARIASVEYSEGPTAAGGRKRLHMKVKLEEGPRYKVRKVSFGPLKAYTPEELEPGLSMLDGDIYSLQKVSDDVTMIRKYYGAKGYADAGVRPDINEAGVEEDGTHLIDIRYDVQEGERFSVGRINVRGNTKTRQHVILRELPLKPGEKLNSVDLETARKRLENLNYFDSVEVSQGLSTTEGYRDINVNVHEKMTGSLTLGVAFSTVENVYVYTTITQSNFDIRGFTNGTFVGGGQRLTLSGKLGTEYKSASVYLLEPWFLDRKLALSNELFYSDSSYMSDYYTQENYGYAIGLRRAIGDVQSLKFEYRIENFSLKPEYDAPLFFRENSGDFTRSHFRLTYDIDTRDAMITPRKGGHFSAFAGYSGPGSTVETYTAGISGSYYYNSVWDSILSVNFGMETIDTVDNDDVVPIFERCYLGGPNNLRGFRYRDVGMVDERLAGDETMGGNTSAFVQFELTVPVIESVRFAVFVDLGFVHEDSFDFKPQDIAADYGFGLRINLPMGPLAVDYAIPFRDGNAADDDPQFQFYVDYKY